MKKTILLLTISVVFVIFHFTPMPLPGEKNTYSSVLESTEGELLSAKIASDEQWRFPPVNTIPEKYVIAVVEYEDKRFYFHPGVDPLAILRAAKSNIEAGKVVSGGSTLTMQLARMVLNHEKRSFGNKIVEAFLALKLEWHFSKDEILGMYANSAPFGGNNVGIGAASWRYFSRLPRDLSWAEASLLAVLPNSPSLIHLARSREILKSKRDALLERLYEKGYFDSTELKLSLLEPIPESPQKVPQKANHLLQYLLEKYPEKNHFKTTIESELQNNLNIKSYRYVKELDRKGIGNVSVVVIDNKTMNLLAFLGNKTYKNGEQYAPYVNIAVSPRSSGSILKPLLYASMLQEGEITSEMLIPDIPTNYEGFTPQNYDREYRGAVPAKEALAQSLNIPAVRMLRSHGIPQFQHDLEDLGVTTLFRSSDDYGLSLILGGAEITLLDITTIYAQLLTIARDRLDEIVNELKILKDEEQRAKRVSIYPGASWLMFEALLEVVRPGTEGYWKDFKSSQKIAWKTGTSYGLRDAWAVGSSARYTVGVWAGNADGRSVAQLSGASTAAPLMFEVFDMLKRSQWIEEPIVDLKEIEVCKDDGYLSGGRCETVLTKIPEQSNFDLITPNHRTVHVETGGQYLVHGACESIENMNNVDWFILPPSQELYWRAHNSSYKVLPPWRKDCIRELASYTNENPIDLVYPTPGSKIYIPVELDGKRGAAVFQAVHRDADAELFWHIDGEYVGKTSLNHTQELDVSSGEHTLTIVDPQGFRLSQRFEVLNK